MYPLGTIQSGTIAGETALGNLGSQTKPVESYVGPYTTVGDINAWNARLTAESDAEDAARWAGWGTGTRAANMPTRSSGAGGYSSTSEYTPVGTLPTYESPTFTAPTRDENRIGALRSRASGSALRGLRTQTQAAIQSSYALPGQARRMTLKEALQGYGGGVSNIMSQADRIARSQYEQEYQDKYREGLLNYQGKVAEAEKGYTAKLAEYNLKNKYTAIMRGYMGAQHGR